MSTSSPSPVSIEYRSSIAIITLNKPQKLNSLTKDEFYDLATLLREADARPKVFVTLLIGKGRFFSAYAHPTSFSKIFKKLMLRKAAQMSRKTAIPHPE
jgi:enoyl-CoA hydratase/carnithine racemase